MSSNPLDNFPLIRSRDIDEVREALGRVYAKPTLVPTLGVNIFNATVNNCRLQAIELGYRAFGAAVRLEFPPTDFISLLLPVCGTAEIIFGQTSVAVTTGTGVITPSDAGHKGNYSADYAHLVLRVRSRVLTEKLAAMTGATINEPLRMSPRQSFEHPAAKMLQQYLLHLIHTLSGADPPFPDWWIAQTEQLLMTLLLCGHRHNYSHLLEQDVPDTAPAHVRQAEEYIEANAARAITLDELAEVTGVSAFGLFSAFRKYRGYSPLEFAAQLRSRRRSAQ